VSAPDDDSATPDQPYQGSSEDLMQLQVVCAKAAEHRLTGLFVITRPEGPAEPESEGENAPGRYSLGIVDKRGYVVALGQDSPWAVILDDDKPQTTKFSIGQKYRGCFMRHANADLARAFVEYLNTGKDRNGDGFADWGKIEEITKELAFELVDKNEGKQLMLKVEEEPTAFLPPGPELYGGWTLYRDMPNADCADVIKQVTKLQCHLGALRYPIGQQERPYWPQPKNPDPKKAAEYYNEGIFEARTQAAFVRFQEHAEKATAARLINTSRTIGAHVKLDPQFEPIGHSGHPWAYVCIDPEGPKDKISKLERHTFGVMDRHSEKAISQWLKEGLRKPGKILLEVAVDTYHTRPGTVWLREEAAVALQLWRQLLRAFGNTRYALRTGHTFRNIVDMSHGDGKALASIHKTGLAMDFGHIEEMRRPRPEFPIRFEGQWREDHTELNRARKQLAQDEEKERAAQRAYDKEKAKGPKAKNLERLQKNIDDAHKAVEKQIAKIAEITERHKQDASAAKLDWRLTWRLYGHSELDVFNWLKPLLPGGVDDVDTLRMLLDEVVAHLENEFRGAIGVKDAATDNWIAKQLDTATTAVAKITRLSNDEIREGFFRPDVRQWLYHPYEEDGGMTDSKDWGPNTANPDYPGAPFVAKSFVNLSKLGALCGLARLGAARKGTWRDRTTTEGKPGKPVMNAFVVSKYFDKIVKLIEHAQSDRSVHAKESFPIKQKKKGSTLVELELPAVKHAFMKRWGQAYPNLLAKKNKPILGNAEVPQLALKVNATPDGEKLLEPLLSSLSSEFGQESFLVVAAGDKTTLNPDAVLEGGELVSKLRVAIAAFKKEFEELKQEQQKKAGKSKNSVQHDWKQWTVVLQPVFHKPPKNAAAPAVGFLPSDTVSLWTPGEPRGLEWWHYQHIAAYDVKWGDLLEEVGFSRDVLRARKSAAEYSEKEILKGATGAAYAVFGRGIGYAESDLDNKKGGLPAEEVENWPTGELPPGG
jgi:hypothetical protein